MSTLLGCGGYNVFQEQGVDIRSQYYYDGTSGQLVAIVTFNANERTNTCAGPADFVEPSCPGDGSILTRTDCSSGAGDGG